MNLTAQELSYIQSQGLYVREKCDGCGAILNQSVRYTIAGKAEVYCSAKCRDAAFFEDRLERKKRSNPGRCANCGGLLQAKRRGDSSTLRRVGRSGLPCFREEAGSSRSVYFPELGELASPYRLRERRIPFESFNVRKTVPARFDRESDRAARRLPLLSDSRPPPSRPGPRP